MLLIKKKSTSKIYLIKHERSYVNVFNACAQKHNNNNNNNKTCIGAAKHENLQRSVGVVVVVVVVVVERAHCTHVAK